MQKYPIDFSEDLDELWKKHDLDGNNWLDRLEAKDFMESLVNCIQEDKKVNYSPEKFESLFDQNNIDNNDYLTKAEMATLIKKIFGGPSLKPKPSSISSKEEVSSINS